MLYLNAKNRVVVQEEYVNALAVTRTEFRKQMKKGVNKFIAELHLPTYKNLTTYYYYDVLDEFTKHVFTEDFL